MLDSNWVMKTIPKKTITKLANDKNIFFMATAAKFISEWPKNHPIITPRNQTLAS
jgi:hypothetical protein